MRLGHARGLACAKTKKFPYLSSFPRRGGVGGADKKWKGNFWFCFAVSVSEKSTIILSYFDCSFLRPHGDRGAHKSPPFLGNIIKRRGLLPSNIRLNLFSFLQILFCQFRLLHIALSKSQVEIFHFHHYHDCALSYDPLQNFLLLGRRSSKL